MGELEESQEKLEVANQRRSRAEQDLQKAKREISKLRKNLNVSQQNLDAKSSELLATAVELEHLKSAQSNHDHGRLEMDDKVDNAGQAEHMVEQIEANRNLVTSLKEKDEELNSLRKVLAERDEQIASNLSKVRQYKESSAIADVPFADRRHIYGPLLTFIYSTSTMYSCV